MTGLKACASLTLRYGDVRGRCYTSGTGKSTLRCLISQLTIDRQMSAWLGRPNLIDQKNLAFKFPNLRLDQSTTEPRVLSPFAHMALQARLGRRVAAVKGDAQSVSDMSAAQIYAIDTECEKWMDELPPIFRVEDPDTSFDEQHPYFVFQRHQLHCVFFVTRLDFLKPFLTRDRHDRMTDQDDDFRRMGVDIAIKLLRVARDLFDHEFPINAKFHMVVFSIFDTATILCSAVIHDRDHVLPHREQVMEGIESCLDMLHQLNSTTRIGAASYSFLAKLVQATPELQRFCPTSKRQRHKEPATLPMPPAAVAVPTTEIAPPELAPNTSFELKHQPPPMTTSDDLSFDLDHFLANNPFGNLSDSSTLDLGGMEQIWDWDTLQLDGYSHQGSMS